MRPETRQCLHDVVSACDEIMSIAGPDGSAYLRSRRDALAIERLFEIVGEALSRTRSLEPALLDEITDASAIIGMRNVLAHGYDAISPERVIDTIRLRVPQLREEARALLA